jgi:hypothetical protein
MASGVDTRSLGSVSVTESLALVLKVAGFESWPTRGAMSVKATCRQLSPGKDSLASHKRPHHHVLSLTIERCSRRF